MRPAAVLGTSYTALPIARSLGRRGVPVFGIEAGPPQIAAHSRYVVLHPPLASEDDLVPALRALAETHGGPVVAIPTSDRFVRSLNAQAEALAPFARFHRLPAQGGDLVTKTSCANALRALSLPRVGTANRSGRRNLRDAP